MSVQIFIPYPYQILYTNRQEIYGRSILLLIIPTYLTVILRIKLWTSACNGGGGVGEWLLLFANVVNDVICCDVKMSKKKY